MLPVIITASAHIDALYEVDANVRKSIASGLQSAYFLACDIDRSGKEAIRFWQSALPVVQGKFAAFGDLHKAEFQWLCESVMHLVSFTLIAWNLYVSKVDTFVESCEKSQEQIIEEQLEELGIATVEQIRVFATAFCQVFGAESLVVEPEIDYSAMTLRQLWEVAKGRISGYRRMNKEALIAALNV